MKKQTRSTTPSKQSWPDGMEMIRQAREALGMFAGAMPITPQQAWEEALDRMCGLAQGRCWACMEREAT